MRHKLILTDPELLLLQVVLTQYHGSPQDAIDSLYKKVEYFIDKSGLEKPHAMKCIVKITD